VGGGLVCWKPAIVSSEQSLTSTFSLDTNDKGVGPVGVEIARLYYFFIELSIPCEET